jgi:hypothetical protein
VPTITLTLYSAWNSSLFLSRRTARLTKGRSEGSWEAIMTSKPNPKVTRTTHSHCRTIPLSTVTPYRGYDRFTCVCRSLWQISPCSNCGRDFLPSDIIGYSTEPGLFPAVTRDTVTPRY